jgi:hypothetical protein
MEQYYQLIERLAEWFMQLFFDPAYHLVSDQKTKTIISRKQEEVAEWWIKQKAALKSIGKNVEINKARRKAKDKFTRLFDSDWMNTVVIFFFCRRWVQLIQ